MRVVSLLPGATEIVCALGAGDQLVGVSHECDHPAWVRGLPTVTRSNVDPRADSASIDDDVRSRLAAGLALYKIDVTTLAALRPDVIVTQHQCDVCAVSFEEVEAAARTMIGGDVRIVSLAPRVLADVWDDLDRVAAALGRQSEARELRGRLAARLATLSARTAALDRPTVACIEWIDPLMLAANWTPELVTMAGGHYPFSAAGAASVASEWTALVAARPDVVVLMPCGFPIAQTRRELDRLRARQEWNALDAVRAGRASVVDGNAFFNRPGPRLVESAEILAAVLHPEACADLMVAGAAEPLSP